MMLLIPVILAVIALLALLWVLQPRVLRKLKARGVPSRTEALLGKTGVVTETVDPNTGTGRVVVAGEDWAAHCGTELPVGTLIHVVGADGIILKISPSEDDATSAKGSL